MPPVFRAVPSNKVSTLTTTPSEFNTPFPIYPPGNVITGGASNVYPDPPFIIFVPVMALVVGSIMGANSAAVVISGRLESNAHCGDTSSTT